MSLMLIVLVTVVYVLLDSPAPAALSKLMNASVTHVKMVVSAWMKSMVIVATALLVSLNLCLVIAGCGIINKESNVPQ